MDVLDARIMHAASAPGSLIQRVLEYSAEYGRRYAAPVEFAGIYEYELTHILVHRRHRDSLAEQAAIDIRELSQPLLQERIALLRLLVEHLEKIAESLREMLWTIVGQIVVEHIPFTEDASILGVQAEYETHAELVQIFRGFLLSQLWSLSIQRIQCLIQASDQFTGALADLHFFGDMTVFHINHELEAVVFLPEISQFDELRRIIRPLHVEYLELLEIASYDPARTLGVRESRRIAFCLLGRLQKRAIALLDRLFQVDVAALLLDHRMRGRYHNIDEAGMGELHTRLKAHEISRIFNTVDLLKQFYPETLAVLLLVALAGPLFRKILSRFLLLCRRHHDKILRVSYVSLIIISYRFRL